MNQNDENLYFYLDIKKYLLFLIIMDEKYRGINKKTGKPNKRPGPKSKLDDPETLEYVIDKLALGFKHVRVADAVGVPETTLCGWFKLPEFRRKLATRQMELADGPLNKILQTQPLVWLERVFKEEFSQPKQEITGDFTHKLLGNHDIEELIAIAKRSRNSSSDKSE